MVHSHGSPEQDLAVAQQALAAGDLEHALYHAVAVVVTNPMRQDALGLMDAALRRAPDPLALTAPEDGETDFGTAAARAYTFAIRGQYAEAFPLLAEVVGTRPDVPFLAWAESWLRVPGVVQMPADALTSTLAGPLLKALPPAEGPNDPVLANLGHAAAIFGLLRQAHPNHGFFWYGASVVARRMNATADAVGLAQQGLRVQPGFLTAVGVACALKDAGQVDAAIAAYHDARRYDPADLSTFLDVGDLLLAQKRLPEAINAYQQVLQKEPQHPWALASMHFARFRQEDGAADRAALLALRDRFPDHDRVWELAQQVEPAKPFFNFIPYPGDETAKALRNVVDMLREHPDRGGGTVTLEVTHPESPSVLTAFRLDTAQVNPPVQVELKVQQLPSPDPRAPKGQVEFVAWQYDGAVARPSIGQPDPGLAQRVAGLAAEPFNLIQWARHAQGLAAQLNPGWVPQLVAVMLHPPAKKLDVSAFLWVQRVQILAALVLAHIDAGWEGSARKKALWALAQGPVDWIVNAALIALAWIARSDPAIRRDVEQLFSWLETQIPHGAYTCFEYPLVCAWLFLGPTQPETKQRLQLKQHQIEHGLTAAVDERYEGLTLEQYAEFCAERELIVGRHAQAQGFGAGAARAAMQGGGAWPELQALCQKYGVTPKTFIEGVGHVTGADSAAVYQWDRLINGDPEVQRRFVEAKARAGLKAQGIDPDSEEGRVAQRIRGGLPMDLEAEKKKAAAAQQQAGGGDPDPVVFPGQRLQKLSDYVGLMKQMQTGDMMGALARYGLDMMSYGQAAQAWGVKLAADPGLNAKFAKMMSGG